MKASRDHRVPFSTEALAILSEAAERRPEGNPLLFPSNIRGVPLSLTSLSLALGRAGGGDATVHGLRSTFRDWTRQQAEDRELAELSLAHAVGDMTERAYARDDLPTGGAACCSDGRRSPRTHKYIDRHWRTGLNAYHGNLHSPVSPALMQESRWVGWSALPAECPRPIQAARAVGTPTSGSHAIRTTAQPCVSGG